MSITIKTRYLIFALIGLILVTFFFGGGLGRLKADREKRSMITALNDTISAYKYRVGNLQKTAYEKDQLVLSQKQAIQTGLLEREELRKLNLKQVSELTRLKFRIDTLLTHVTHNGQVVTIHDTLTINNVKNAILLPFDFYKVDTWMPDSLKGHFDKYGDLSIKFKMQFGVDVWTGKDKTTKDYKSVVTTDCPYIKVIDIKSQKFDVPKPKKFAIGVQAGYGLVLSRPLGFAPYVGVGINYSILRF